MGRTPTSRPSSPCTRTACRSPSAASPPDITERKKRRAEHLRDSQALYHSLVETLPVCIFRKDLEGRFTFVNAPFCNELHRSESEILGRCDRDFFPEDLAQKYMHDDHEVVAAGVVFECVEEHMHAGGRKALRAGHQVAAVRRGRPGRSACRASSGTSPIASAPRKSWPAPPPTSTWPGACSNNLFPAAGVPLVCDAAERGFDIAGESYPVDAVGGDYSTISPWTPHRLAVAVGDVSGHGVGPALLMAVARAYLRACCQESGGQASPGEVLAQVNHLLANDIEGDRYITLLLAWIDLQHAVAALRQRRPCHWLRSRRSGGGQAFPDQHRRAAGRFR